MSSTEEKNFIHAFFWRSYLTRWLQSLKMRRKEVECSTGEERGTSLNSQEGHREVRVRTAQDRKPFILLLPHFFRIVILCLLLVITCYSLRWSIHIRTKGVVFWRICSVGSAPPASSKWRLWCVSKVKVKTLCLRPKSIKTIQDYSKPEITLGMMKGWFSSNCHLLYPMNIL